MPLPRDDSALVVSDNGDIYGTVSDLWERYWQGDAAAAEGRGD